MDLTIIYDNTIHTKNIGLKSDWGFACIINNNDEKILFDTGAKGKILLRNMQKLNIKVENISKIVISHEHWDHNGGLEELLCKLKGEAKIYRFNEDVKNKNSNIVVKEPLKLSEDIYSTGRMNGDPVDEQSLILKGQKGYYAIAGCSHSGVENILKETKKIGNVAGIIGGLHGFDNFSILENLEVICPAHCTKYKEQIYKLFPKKVIDAGVGKTIKI